MHHPLGGEHASIAPGQTGDAWIVGPVAWNLFQAGLAGQSLEESGAA